MYGFDMEAIVHTKAIYYPYMGHSLCHTISILGPYLAHITTFGKGHSCFCCIYNCDDQLGLQMYCMLNIRIALVLKLVALISYGVSLRTKYPQAYQWWAKGDRLRQNFQIIKMATCWLPNYDEFFFSLGYLLSTCEPQLNSTPTNRSEFLFQHLDKYERTLWY